MKRFLNVAIFFTILLNSLSLGQPTPDKREFELTYGKWRQAVATKNFSAWKSLTATHRQISTRNKILSEKRAYPASIFNIPALPPALKNLGLVKLTQKGLTAKAVYFGKVDFGVGGKPTDNLLMLTFVREAGQWKFDQAEFLNLTAIPDVVTQLKKGDTSYFKGKAEFSASGVSPRSPRSLQAPAPLIAKTYVFCPGRKVELLINIIGGARLGANEIQYTTKVVAGAKGSEALAIRVYLMSQKPGVKPLKVYDYSVQEGAPVKPVHTARFSVSEADAKQMIGAH